MFLVRIGPNQAFQPMPAVVMPAAGAPVTPTAGMAELGRSAQAAGAVSRLGR